jgi:hypothetical protein
MTSKLIIDPKSYLPGDDPSIDAKTLIALGATQALYPQGIPFLLNPDELLHFGKYSVYRKYLPERWRSATFTKLIGKGSTCVVIEGINQYWNQYVGRLLSFKFAVKVQRATYTVLDGVRREAQNVKEIGSKWGYYYYDYFELPDIGPDSKYGYTLGFLCTNTFQMTLQSFRVNFPDRSIRAMPNIIQRMKDQLALFWIKTGRALTDVHSNNFMISFAGKRDKPHVYLIDLDESYSYQYKETDRDFDRSSLDTTVKGAFDRIPQETQEYIYSRLNVLISDLYKI